MQTSLDSCNLVLQNPDYKINAFFKQTSLKVRTIKNIKYIF